MITREQLADAFARNVRIIEMQIAGLSHAHSLLQPPFRGNCMNWVLGHIAFYRNDVLRALGQDPALGRDALARYETGLPAITCEEEGVVSLEVLVDALQRSQERIAEGLRRPKDDDFQHQMEEDGHIFSVAEYLFGLYFHETYHVGQTELLRQLAGMNDSVI